MFRKTILSVFFNGQFWVAEIERHEEGRIEMTRYCFGPEPSNAELLEWVDRALPSLRFYTHVGGEGVRVQKSLNPKQAKRAAAAEAAKIGFSSKAQETMKAALEAHKKERSSERKQRTEEKRDRLWLLRQKKIKERRRGH